MGISDNVAAYILNMINEANGTAEIQRNELAGILGCVPSQINYVITSRFTPEQGYVVESRRGGGGYIRITRRVISPTDMIMHIVNSIGNNIDAGSTRVIIKNLAESNILSLQEARLISAATSDKALVGAPKENRDAIRAAVLKNMLLVTQQ